MGVEVLDLLQIQATVATPELKDATKRMITTIRSIPGQPMLSLSTSRDVRERYSSNDQADRHAKNGDQENLAAAEPVHDKQVDEREDEVGGRDSDGNSGGVAESDNFEQGGAVVHECAKKMH
jgi:hypothetical protein